MVSSSLQRRESYQALSLDSRPAVVEDGHDGLLP